MRTTIQPDHESQPAILATHGAIATILGAASIVCLACAPDYIDDNDEARSSALLDAIDYAEPVEVRALTPAPSEPDNVDAGNDCTLEARPAALISVIDQYGQRLSGTDDEVTLIYTHRERGGEWDGPIKGACIDETCENWAIGYEAPGEYIVGAFACDTYEVVRFRVGMTDDGCHVDTVTTRIPLELERSCFAADTMLADETVPSCDPSEAQSPSVIAMTGVIRGDMVIPQTPKAITLQYANEEVLDTMNCLHESCTSFVSEDHGVAGEFTVRAELCGEELTRSVSVAADADGCNVETQWVGLYSDAPQCAVSGYQAL